MATIKLPAARAAVRPRKAYVRYRVVVKHASEIIWQAGGVPTSNMYAAQYAADTLNKFMRETGTQNIAVVSEE